MIQVPMYKEIPGRASSLTSIVAKLKVYYSLIRPKLLYGLIAWGYIMRYNSL